MLTLFAGVVIGAACAVAALYLLSRRARTLRPPHLSAEHSDDTMPPRPEAPPAIDPRAGERGHLRPALLGVLMLVAAGLFATRCAPTQRALLVAAAAPVASPCTPGAQRCDGASREVCGRDATGDARWWPADPPYPDGGARACATSCALTDAGVAVCTAPTDGGAP